MTLGEFLITLFGDTTEFSASVKEMLKWFVGGCTIVGGKTVCYTARPYGADVGPPGRTCSFISFLNIFEP